MFIGRTDVEAEASVVWLPDVKSQLTGKDPVLGKIEGKRRKGWQRMRWLDSSKSVRAGAPWKPLEEELERVEQGMGWAPRLVPTCNLRHDLTCK